MGDSVKTKDTPAPSSRTLTAHPDGDDFDEHFHYRSIIGKLNHLKKCTSPTLATRSINALATPQNPSGSMEKQ
jgi:hypothetical protein